MNSAGVCALLLLPVAIFIFLVVWLLMNASIPGGRARFARMKAAAAQLGWTYVQSVPFTSIPGAPSLYLFSNGRRYTVHNLMSGQRDGRQMGLFDHTFNRPGNARAVFVHTIVFTASDAALPVFALATPLYFRRARLATPGPVMFPNHPKFSREYMLIGTDESAVRRVLSDAVLEYCETHPGLCIENRNGLLVVFREGMLAPPQSLGFYFDEVNTLLQMFASGLSGTPMAPPPLPPPT